MASLTLRTVGLGLCFPICGGSSLLIQTNISKDCPRRLPTRPSASSIRTCHTSSGHFRSRLTGEFLGAVAAATPRQPICVDISRSTLRLYRRRHGWHHCSSCTCTDFGYLDDDCIFTSARTRDFLETNKRSDGSGHGASWDVLVHLGGRYNILLEGGGGCIGRNALGVRRRDSDAEAEFHIVGVSRSCPVMCIQPYHCVLCTL